MIRKGLKTRTIIVVTLSLALTVWCMAWSAAQESGSGGASTSAGFAEAVVEVIKKDAGGILYTRELSFITTRETVVIWPDGRRSSITGQAIPFKAVVVYRAAPADSEGGTPVAAEIRILAQEPE